MWKPHPFVCDLISATIQSFRPSLNSVQEFYSTHKAIEQALGWRENRHRESRILLKGIQEFLK
jgi:hypothetical protein